MVVSVAFDALSRGFSLIASLRMNCNFSNRIENELFMRASVPWQPILELKSVSRMAYGVDVRVQAGNKLARACRNHSVNRKHLVEYVCIFE